MNYIHFFVIELVESEGLVGFPLSSDREIVIIDVELLWLGLSQPIFMNNSRLNFLF